MKCVRVGPLCRHCQRLMADGEERECTVGDVPPEPDWAAFLDEDEKRAIFGGHDPTLIGNRIAALTKSLGFPPCRGCQFRQEWINRAHVLLRETIWGS